MARKGNNILVNVLGNTTGVQDALGETASMLGGFGGTAAKALGAGLLTAGVAGGGALVMGIGEAMNREALNDMTQAALGISEEEAAQLGRDASRGYANAWGDSVEDVQLALGEMTKGGLLESGESIDDMTAAAFGFADAFQTDVSEGITAATALMKNDMVGDGQEAFDLLTTLAQQLPAGIQEEVFAATEEYSQYFQALGLDGSQMFAGFSDFSEDGARDLDMFGDALKELTIRGSDMSASSVDAFESMGLSAADMSEMFLEGGDSAQAAFQITAQSLAAIEDPVEQAAASIALFGTPLEDLGTSEIPAFLDSLTGMTAGMGDVSGASVEMANQLGDNLATRMEGLKRRGMEAFVGFIQSNVFPAVLRLEELATEYWPKVQEVGATVFEALRDYVSALKDAFEVVWPVIQDVMVAVFDWALNVGLPLYIDFIESVGDGIAGLVELFVEHWPTIKATMVAVFDWLIGTGWPIVKDVFELIMLGVDEVLDLFNEHWPAIQEIVETAIETIWEGVEFFITTATLAWELFGDEIIAFAKGAWSFISDFIGATLTTIKGVFDIFKGIFTGDWGTFWSGIKSVVSGIWDGIKALIGLAIDAVVLVISTGWEGIKAGTDAAWGGIKGAIDSIWESIKTAVGEAIGAVVTTIEDKISGAATWITEQGTAFYDSAVSIINKVKDGVVDTFTGVSTGISEWFQGGLDQLTGMLGSAYSGAFEFGGKILGGIIDALATLKDWITDNVLGPIQGAIDLAQDAVNLIPGVSVGEGGKGVGGPATDSELLDAIVKNSNPNTGSTAQSGTSNNVTINVADGRSLSSVIENTRALFPGEGS